MKHHLTTYSHIVLRKRYKDITFSVMYETINGGLVEKFNEGTQSKTEKYKNIEALKILADNGRKYRLLPVIQDRQKNPDAFNLINLRYVDIKVAESTNGKNAIQSALKEANSLYVCDVIIYFSNLLVSFRVAFNMLKATFRQKRAKYIEIIIFIMPDKRVLQVDTKRFK